MPVPKQGSNLQVSDDRLEALTRGSWRGKARQKVNETCHFRAKALACV